ncbi:MAG: proprotein convertase P-domain-containing protein [Bacteroidota bacterium]
MKNAFLVFIHIICLSPFFNQIKSQCNDTFCPPGQIMPGNCPDEACLICTLTDLDGYTGNTFLFDSSPCQVTGSICFDLDAGQWFAFVAPSATVEFEITVANCTGTSNGSGIEAVIMDPLTANMSCSSYDPTSNCSSTGTSAPANILADNLVPGETYYLLIDPFERDSCEFTIEVIQGTNPYVAPAPGSLSIYGPTSIDYAGVYNPTSNFGASALNADFFTWRTEPPNAGTITALNNTSTAEISWEILPSEDTEVNICATPYNGCTSGQESCRTVSLNKMEQGINCENPIPLCGDLNNFKEILPDVYGEAFYPGCPPLAFVLNNAVWYSFIAGSETIIFEITPDNCEFASNGSIGLQAGIYEGCGSMGQPLDLMCIGEEESPIELSSSQFYPGRTYLLLLDGYAGSICEYSIDLIEGSIEGGQPHPDITIFTNETVVCPGHISSFSSNLTTSDIADFQWTVDQNLGQIISPTDSKEIEVEWNAAGSGQVCLEVTSDCFSGTASSCIEMTISNGFDLSISGQVAVCPNSLSLYSPTPNGCFSNYQWSLGSGGSIISPLDSSAAVINWTDVGDHELCLAYEDGNGVFRNVCKNVLSRDSFHVELVVDGSPAPAQEDTVSICANNTLPFSIWLTTGNDTVQDLTGYDFTWTLNEDESSNESEVDLHFPSNGFYDLDLEIRSSFDCQIDTLQSWTLFNAGQVEFEIAYTPFDSICPGDTVTLTASIQNDTFPISNPMVQNFGDGLAIPDGMGQLTEVITVDDFSPGQVFTNVGDIEVCVNMEHSWLRDLEISLVCPNGQTMILHDLPSNLLGEVFLGIPVENDEGLAAPVPGIGFDYCWNAFTTSPTWTTYANTVLPSTLPSDAYSPFEPFENLMGCPLNGDWELTIKDSGNFDNGVLFEWSLNLQGKDSTTYSINHMLEWENDPDLIFYSSDSIVVSPDSDDTYTLLSDNNFGCSSSIEIPVPFASANICDPSCDSFYVDAGPDLELTCLTPFPLFAEGMVSDTTGGVEYLWENLSGLFYSDESELEIYESIPYVLTATNSLGCTDTDTLVVSENFSLEPSHIEGNSSPCQGTIAPYYVANDSFPGTSYEWYIDPPLGNISSPSTGVGIDSITIEWVSVGTAYVFAEVKNLSCFGTILLVDTVEICPMAPMMIVGDTVVTVNMQSGYSIDLSDDDFDFNWSVGNCGVIASNTDSSAVLINWIAPGNGELCVTYAATGTTDSTKVCLDVLVVENFVAAIEFAGQLFESGNDEWITVCLSDSLHLQGFISANQNLYQELNGIDFIWNFDDNLTLEGSVIGRTFEEPGCYLLNLFLENMAGFQTLPLLQQKIRVIPVPGATVMGPDAVCSGDIVALVAHPTLSTSDTCLNQTYDILTEVNWVEYASMLYYSPDSIVVSIPATTNYLLNVSDNFGCQTMIEYELEVLPNSDSLCFQCDSFSIDADEVMVDCNFSFPIEVIGATPFSSQDVIYFWTDGVDQLSNDSSVLIFDYGTYIYHAVHTPTGCETTDTLLFVNNDVFPIADAGEDQELDCPLFTATLDGSNSSTGSQFIYNWSLNGVDTVFSNELVSDIFQPGTYVLEVIDTINGCSSEDAVIIFAPDPPIIVSESTPDSCSLSVGTATLTVEWPSGPVQYFWENGETTETITGLNFGDYNVTITYGGDCEEAYSVFVDSIDCVNSTLEEITGLTDLKVVPNPNDGAFEIFFQLKTNAPLSFSLINALSQKSKLLYEEKMYHSGRHRLPVNILDFPNGIYYLKILSAESIVSERFIKLE